MRELPLGRKRSARCRSAASRRSEKKPWKLLLWTALAGLIFGLIGFGELAEDYLRIARNSLPRAQGQRRHRRHQDRRPSRFGKSATGPGRGATMAQLVDRLTAAGAKRIFFDINFSYPSIAADDQAFADAIAALGPSDAVRPAPSRDRTGRQADIDAVRCRCSRSTRSSASAASTTIIRMPSGSCLMPRMMDGKTVPSFAAALANVDGHSRTRRFRSIIRSSSRAFRPISARTS